MSEPEPNQAMAGDHGWMVGANLGRARYALAASVSRTWQHDVDNEGTFFDARGIEAYAELAPRSDHTVFLLLNAL